MANDMEFTISAKDQASRAVETVQKKLKNFGRDLAKMALGFAAPLALAQAAFQAVGDAIEKHRQKIRDAIDNTAELADKASDLGVSVEEYQKLSNAADAAGMSIDKVAKAFTEVQKLLASAAGDGIDTAKMLESLGFAADDIAKGLVKPMDVIEKLGAAMLGAKDDSTAFKIATAVLGETLAKDLLPQLKAAMDLAAGFGDDSGLTDEEAGILRDKKKKETQKKNKEALAEAKKQASKEFLENDAEAGKVAAMFPSLTTKGLENDPALSKEMAKSLSGIMSENPEVQKAIQEILKQRAATERERLRVANEAKAAEILSAADALKAENEATAFADAAIAAGLTESEKAAAKSKADADKAAQKAKDDKIKADEKAAEDRTKMERDALGEALDEEAKGTSGDSKSAGKMTLSSLREIGGGLSGEALVNDLDVQREALDISKSILLELQKLNLKTLPEVPSSTDFTKLTTTA